MVCPHRRRFSLSIQIMHRISCATTLNHYVIVLDFFPSSIRKYFSRLGTKSPDNSIQYPVSVTEFIGSTEHVKDDIIAKRGNGCLEQ